MRSSDGRLWVVLKRHGHRWLRSCFPVFAAGCDAAVLLAAALASGLINHWLFLTGTPPQAGSLGLAGVMALLVLLARVLRHEYPISRFLGSKGFARSFLPVWTMIFLSAAALAFLTRTGADYPRPAILIFYGLGFSALVATRSLLCHVVQSASRRGTVSVRRTFLIGTAEELRRFGERYQPWNLGVEIVGVATLGILDAGVQTAALRQLDGDLDRAVSIARTLELDDVFILTPWGDELLVQRCVDAFLNLPAAIHLGPATIFDRFEDVRIEKIGPISTLNVVRRPLSLAEQMQKRLLDVVIAGSALLLLSPLLIAVGIAIRLDSPGPAVFRQRRFGFNQKPFTIYKFRSMRTMEDGNTVVQAKRNDERVTRIGAFLRRTSIDELPQLLNVLLGQMSLVGPRPHALAHDRAYERKIALYARRHNVKPGITGWAQVNGHRGETATDDCMRERVRHDLYYIDNWSVALDLRILVMTALSPKTRRNAY